MRVIAWMAVALVASPLPAQDRNGKAAYQELNAEFVNARLEYRAQAQENGEPVDLKVVAESFLPRFEMAAKKYAGTEDAVPFLAWIVFNFQEDKTRVNRVIDDVLDHHIESPQLVKFIGFESLRATMGEERAAELKGRIIAQGHPEVKVFILYWWGLYTLLREPNANAKAKEAALEDLRQAAKLGGHTGGRAELKLFELENLKIGMAAPDIVGDDLDGVEFNLSDYRGKVVVLDFWGDC